MPSGAVGFPRVPARTRSKGDTAGRRRHQSGVSFPLFNALISFCLALAAVPAAAAPAPSPADSLPGALLSVGVLIVAAALHWGLRRVGRRLPRWLAQRSGQASSTVVMRWQGLTEVVLLVPKIAIWGVALTYVSDQFALLLRLRQLVAHVVEMSVSMPLFTLEGHAYAATDVLELPLVLAALWIGVSALTRVLRSNVLAATGMEPGVQDAVALLTRCALTFIGAIVILQVWHIDVSSLTFVASVLGVGIGFGLQNIANNFVSGLVVSLERPIQPGDFVKVDDWEGTVEHIGPRNTEIRTLDNVSILIPNSRFLESEVVNWSHRDPVSRLHVPVGIAYGSEIVHVRAALFEAAQAHPDVLGDPRPRVEFRGFGDSALQFELLVWTRDPRIQHRLISDLNYRIEANLRRHHVQVPFPQRDLHLRSPQLDQLLGAWGRRNFSEAELLPQGNGSKPEAPQLAAEMGVDFSEERNPRDWSEAEIGALVARMRGGDGLRIVDRRHLLTTYPKCFVGREAVDWMTRAAALTRKEAVAVGQLLMDRGIIRHVLDEHGFKDDKLFYRFRAADVSM
jgi:potassium-dependent mechanosensitive channel